MNVVAGRDVLVEGREMNPRSAAVVILDRREGSLVCVACVDRCREKGEALCLRCGNLYDNEVEQNPSIKRVAEWVKGRRGK